MSAPETAKHFFYGMYTLATYTRYLSCISVFVLFDGEYLATLLSPSRLDLFYGFDLLDESTTTYYISRFSQQTHSISFNVSADFTLPLPDQPGLSFGASNSSSAKFFSFVC